MAGAPDLISTVFANPKLLVSAVSRFHEKVDCRPGDQCWPWTGKAHLNKGYGALGVWHNGRTRTIGAHRFAWALTNGHPGEMHVLHKCDNPKCCNPAHLFLGTNLDNILDARAKGRMKPPPLHCGDGHHKRRHPERIKVGSEHFNAKLTEEVVRNIRKDAAEGVTPTVLSRTYMVTRSTIGSIIKRETWRHV